MLRKVFRTGNSVVVSLPREALEFLDIQEGTEVEVDLDRENRQVILKPVEESLAASGIDEKFARQVVEFIEHYRPALERLASEESAQGLMSPEELQTRLKAYTEQSG